MPAPKGNRNAKGNKGGGRPTKYKPEFCEQAQKLVMLGLTDQQIADVFGVGERTLNDWKHGHVEFSAALKLGSELAADMVERSLFRMAMGYEKRVQKSTQSGKVVELIEYFPPQVGAASKFLACKRKDVWAEKNVGGVQHQLSIDEGLRAMLQEMGERSRQSASSVRTPVY